MRFLNRGDARVLDRMAAESEVAWDWAAAAAEADAEVEAEANSSASAGSGYLQKFALYKTALKFYMVGRDKSRRLWRVLTIDRSEPCELNITEDPTTYSEIECYDSLKRIHDENRSSGGLNFVTKCYGIVGFFKFLGPYYMLLITRRRKIGTICGHAVYAILKSETIAFPHSTVGSNMANSKDENRYMRLLCMVDLTKDFFFSYSYNVMRSLQKNACDGETGQALYETMFVWNEFLTRGIRNHLKNTIWTVALVYGFFVQEKLSISEKDFILTLIARRSRHFAGTRYLKRGVDEKGRVANDVETEQIVFEDVSGEVPTQVTSVVQNRGSIPLFWSQKTTGLNVKPDIILHKKDQNYEASRLHFDNLVKRYGNPIIILNLIKTCEKKPRESLLRAEFVHVIDYINKDLSEESRLRFLHWDLHKHSRRKDINVLALLGKAAACALDLTGIFYCRVIPVLPIQVAPKWPIIAKDTAGDSPCNIYDSRAGVVKSGNGSSEDKGNSNISGSESPADNSETDGSSLSKQPTFQKGVLRTNCIDCLDRTNIAQYAYGLAALGHQLHALGFIDVPGIDQDAPLAGDLMGFYERMGDALALQYGGSGAHNKIFCERRGQWKATTQSQELFKTLHRYYSNMYTDAKKQDAINVFLGHFQPQQGKPALWELLHSNQHSNIGRHGDETARSVIKKSLSELPQRMHLQGDDKGLCESDMSYSRCTSAMQLLADGEHGYSTEHRVNESNCSNFLDLDWEEEASERSYSIDPGLLGNFVHVNVLILDKYASMKSVRSSLINSPFENLSTENVMNGVNTETTSEEGSCSKLEQHKWFFCAIFYIFSYVVCSYPFPGNSLFIGNREQKKPIDHCPVMPLKVPAFLMNFPKASHNGLPMGVLFVNNEKTCS
uniref:Phosphoinositide phosphatase SAC2 n=1 Tax=Elaeis guineensis var. tenera TaxID=51953 RepID=A0A8N4F5P8_ELAGV|nr:phosphoinositide phosphatase SAC2 [Elaeis guineensis]